MTQSKALVHVPVQPFARGTGKEIEREIVSGMESAEKKVSPLLKKMFSGLGDFGSKTLSSFASSLAAKSLLEKTSKRDVAGDTTKSASEKSSSNSKDSDSSKPNAATSAITGAVKSTAGLLKNAFTSIAGWGTKVIGGFVKEVGLKGGIDQALGIESVQAKLKTLGHDTAAVDQIMGNAFASVKGTAFGIDEAATAAANAIAAGIQPGQQLEKHLRLTADAASFTGMSMEEMGTIMNRVHTNGVVSMDDINKMTEKGIPIMDTLAKQYGVSADELANMVSRGEVDAAAFSAALDANIGGAALAATNTTAGAFARMKTSLSTLGTSVLGPFVERAKDLFNEISVIFEGLSERLTPFAKRLDEVFGGRLSTLIDGFGDRFLKFFDKVAAPLMQAASIITPFGGALSLLGVALGGVCGDLAGTASAAEVLASGLGEALLEIAGTVVPLLLNGFVSLLPTLIGVLTQVFQTVVDLIVTLLPTVIQTIVAALPLLIEGATTLFMGFLQALVTVIPMLVEGILEAIPILTTALITMLPMLIDGATQLFMALVQAIAIILPPLAMALVEVIPVIITALLAALPMLLEGAITLFLALIQAITIILPPLITALVAAIPVIVEALLAALPMLLEGAVMLFLALIQAIPLILPPLLEAIVGMIPMIVSMLIASIPTLLSAAVTLFRGLVDAIPKIIPELLSAARGIVGDVIQAVVACGPSMLDAGKDLIAGLGQGFMNGVRGVIDKARDVAETIVSNIKGFFGIHSPSRLFRDEIGKQLVAGLAIGLEADTDALLASKKLSQNVAAAFGDIPFTLGGQANLAGYGKFNNALANQQIEQTFNIVSHDPQVAAAFAASETRAAIGVMVS